MAKLAALVLITAQVVVGVVAGRAVCVPVGVCGLHECSGEVGAETCCDSDESEASALTNVDIGCGGHEHGLIDLEQHVHPHCGCHVHVLISGEEPSTGASKPRVRVGELTDGVVAAVWDARREVDKWSAMGSVRSRAHPPDGVLGHQSRVIRTTRLRL